MVRYCMASDSGEILKSGTDRVTVQLQLIPTPLPHQTPENFPVCGEILESGMDRFIVQLQLIPTRYLQAQHRKKYPFRGDFFKSGMDHFMIQPHSIPTPLPHQTPENFPVCGEILKSGTDRVTVQLQLIPTHSPPCRTASMISSMAFSTFWRLAASLEA